MEKDPAIDPEKLAALLDGRLDEPARSELIAHLASSDDDYEVLLDATSLVGEDGEDSVAPAGSGRRPAWLMPRATHWLAIAALLAAVVALPALWPRGASSWVEDPGSTAVRLAASGYSLAPGWDTHPWRATRGSRDPLTPTARAIRIGARIADLEILTAAGDPAAAAAADEIADLLGDLPASGPTVSLYRAIARQSGDSRADRAQDLATARRSAAPLAGAELVGLGAWLEAARIAASERDVDFFRDGPAPAVLARARDLPDLPAAALQAIDRLDAALRTDAVDPALLEPDLTLLLGALGS